MVREECSKWHSIVSAQSSLKPSSESEGELISYFRHPDIPDGDVCSQCGYVMAHHGWIDTLEGGHRVCPGD